MVFLARDVKNNKHLAEYSLFKAYLCVTGLTFSTNQVAIVIFSIKPKIKMFIAMFFVRTYRGLNVK